MRLDWMVLNGLMLSLSELSTYLFILWFNWSSLAATTRVMSLTEVRGWDLGAVADFLHR